MMSLNTFTILIKCVIFTIIVKCVLADGVFSFNKLDQNKVNENYETVCPNNRTKCTNEQTCCVTKHNSYHCCRYSNAVCCPDKYHCCPHGFTCDSEQKRCTRNLEDQMEWPVVEIKEKPLKKMVKLKPSLTLYRSQPDSESLKISKEITCPNNKTKCKDTKTCCITKHGNYYCCPHKNAVCCSDKYQCCPEKTTCDLENKKCVNSPTFTNTYNRFTTIDEPFYLKPASINKYSLLLDINKFEKKCSNNQYQCPGKKNCCAMENGKFGCCKFDKGVCCSDLKTCCPHDTQCDVKSNTCVSKSLSLVPLIEENRKKVPSNICPDKKIDCQSFETCCFVGDGLYGCCPFKNATCCSDKSSCCPYNKICDLKNKQCKPKEKIQSYVVERKSLISFYSAVGLKNTCPDKSKCEGQYTCCLTENNGYGCCPYTSGACCPDKKTCCPNGFKCLLDGCEQNEI